jgi:hypothetical protein
MVFIPHDQRLVYDFFGPASAMTALPGLLLFLMATLGTFWLTWRRSPAALGGWLYLASYLPAANLLVTIWHVFDERYLYFPMFGLLFAAAPFLAQAIRMRPSMTRPLLWSSVWFSCCSLFVRHAPASWPIRPPPGAKRQSARPAIPGLELPGGPFITVSICSTDASLPRRKPSHSVLLHQMRAKTSKRWSFPGGEYESLPSCWSSGWPKIPDRRKHRPLCRLPGQNGRCDELKNLLEQQAAPLPEQLKNLAAQCPQNASPYM